MLVERLDEVLVRGRLCGIVEVLLLRYLLTLLYFTLLYLLTLLVRGRLCGNVEVLLLL